MTKAKEVLRGLLHDQSAFRYLYIMNLFFCSVCLISPVSEIIKGFLLVWAFFLLADVLFIQKSVYRIRYWGLLLAFVTAGMITTLIHARDNLLGNLIMLYHACVCFFLFYGIHAEPDRQKIRRELYGIFESLIWVTTVFSVIGLLIVAVCVRFYIGSYCFGLMDNRYTGLYINPNLAAFASVVSLVCCHFMLGKRRENGKRYVPRGLAAVCFISNLCVLFLSDSNASLVFTVVYSGLYAAYKLARYFRRNNRAVGIRHGALLLCAWVIVLAASFGARSTFQSGVAFVLNDTQEVMHTSETADWEQTEKAEQQANARAADQAMAQETASVQQDAAGVTIGRSDYEISSGRFDSLQKALQLFVRYPFMGIGKANILDYGDRYLSEGFLFTDVHNGYLTILLSGGLCGLALFMAFLVLIARRMLKCVDRRLLRFGREREDFPILVAALGGYSVYSLFEKTLLYDITFMVLIFWLLMGYAMCYLERYELRQKRSRHVPALRMLAPGIYVLPVPTRGYLASEVMDKVQSRRKNA